MEEMKKENDGTLTAKTERGKMEMPTTGGDMGSAGLGKFKDANALLQAYLALEAEFTRRSQRLKTLENEREKRMAGGDAKSEKTEVAKLDDDGGKAETDGDTECASVIPEAQSSSPNGKNQPENTGVCGTDENDGMLKVEEKENSFPEAEGSRVDQATTNDELYKAVLANESVRLKVIGEYLNSIVKNSVPIVKGGAGTLAVAAKRAENIASAGEMALRMFKKHQA